MLLYISDSVKPVMLSPSPEQDSPSTSNQNLPRTSHDHDGPINPPSENNNDVKSDSSIRSCWEPLLGVILTEKYWMTPKVGVTDFYNHAACITKDFHVLTCSPFYRGDWSKPKSFDRRLKPIWKGLWCLYIDYNQRVYKARGSIIILSLLQSIIM